MKTADEMTDEEFTAAVEEWTSPAAKEIDALKSAIVGLLRFHQEGDDGAELPREYWSPGYREAVEYAEALIGPNAEFRPTHAASSREVAPGTEG